jgi:hypothetical protein
MIDLETAKQILANPAGHTPAEIIRAMEIISKNALSGL